LTRLHDLDRGKLGKLQAGGHCLSVLRTPDRAVLLGMSLAPLPGSDCLRTARRAIRLASDRYERPSAMRANAKLESRLAERVVRQGLELLQTGVCSQTGSQHSPVGVELVLDTRGKGPLLADAQQPQALNPPVRPPDFTIGQ